MVSSEIIKEIDNAVEILKLCKMSWANQVENDGEPIADSDAIVQVIRCLEEWKESEIKISTI